MKNIVLNENEYELIQKNKEVFDSEIVKEKCTDYFAEFDYIFGDYAYDKLRLKGFYDETNDNVKDINNIKYLNQYIENYCAYNCGYFLLKKIK
ncbi:MAG: YutD-like domain-containing protein [Bacilli bacterium]